MEIVGGHVDSQWINGWLIDGESIADITTARHSERDRTAKDALFPFVNL